MSAVAAFELTSTVTQGAAPFVVGHTFAEGAIPTGEYAHLDISNFSVVPLNVWNDGSLKFAALLGRVSLTANVPFQVNVLRRTTASSVGTVLTSASILAAAPTASIQFGANGTATLANLGSPKRTWYSTKEAVCCEYVAMAGSDAHLWAQFFVWVFADGRRFIRAVANNGFFMGGAAQRNYVPTITIDGVMVFNNTGAIYYHSYGASWDVTHWTGTDPQIIPRHDTGKLMASKMVPNYERTSNASALITYLANVSGYTPGARLGYSDAMGSTGFQDDIGLLAQWEGQYFVMRGAKEAYNAVIDNGRAIRSYAICYPDSTTFDPIKLADWPTYTLGGAGGGGQTAVGSAAQDGTTSYVWEIAHHPSAGFLPYLLTADPYYLQTCQHQAKLCFLVQTSGSGSGTSRTVSGQVRGRAWSYRSIAQAAAICPDSMLSVYGDSKTWYANLMASSNTYYSPLSATFHGLVDQYDTYLPAGQAADGSNCAGVSLWQHDFLIGSIGHALDIQPCSSSGMTSTLAFFNYAAKSSVWRLGPPNDVNSYCFTYASSYYMSIPKSTPLGDGAAITAAQAIPNNAGEIFLHSNGAVSTTDNTLHGGSGGDPSIPSGYWGQVLMGVAPAIDYGVSGALAGYNRIIGAANYSTTIATADYAFVPNFGVVARAVAQQSNTFTPVDSGATMATAGPSFVWDNVPLISGAFVWDTYRGLGIPSTDIPTGFTYPALLANDVDAINDPAGTEYRVGEVLFASSAIKVVIGNHSEITVTAADGVSAPPDGTYTGTQNVYKNGPVDTGTISIAVGVADTTIPVMVGTLASSAVTSTGFTLSWSAATDNVAVTGYEVSTNNGTSYVDAGNVLTVAKTGLTASTTYNTKVRAYDGAGNRATPLSLDVATSAASDTTAPTMSGSLTVSSITSSGFTIGWSAASDNVAVTGYELSTDNGGTYASVGNVLTYACTGKAPSTLYNVKVRAYDAASNKATPLSTTATTSASSDVTAPVLGGVITISAITTGGFTASWDAATDAVGVTGYEISVDAGTPAYTSVGNVLTTTKTALASATLYNVRVRAFDAAGNRSTAITTTVTTATPTTFATSVTLTFQDRNGTLRANLTGMKWAFFDQATPDALGTPSAKGSLATTNSSGVATLNITGTQLAPGAIGWLIFSNSDGTATQSNLISFAGPCVTA